MHFSLNTCLTINIWEDKAQSTDASADGESIGMEVMAVCVQEDIALNARGWEAWTQTSSFALTEGIESVLICGWRIGRTESSCMCKLSRMELRMDLQSLWYPDIQIWEVLACSLLPGHATSWLERLRWFIPHSLCAGFMAVLVSTLHKRWCCYTRLKKWLLVCSSTVKVAWYLF